ncbi:MAG: two-component sensor histidine kinase, partial [Pricia sp.]|nr:two-component sensor histidine kinase [Pricia sp.]
TFTSLQGINIYRIIQEAMNNSLKYANASEIGVNFDIKDGFYQLNITDNGVGFNLDEVEIGNGLDNLKKRAGDLNGTLLIDSKKPEGTKILVSYPV